MPVNKNIVWIASYPKSGNTWFRVFLANILQQKGNPANINELEISGMASGRHLFDELSGIPSSDLSTSEIDSIRPKVYRQLAAESEETIYLKVHDAWTRNACGTPLFPVEVSKKVLYIIRHPLDVAVSLSYHNAEPVARSMDKMNNASYGLCMGEKKLFNQLPQRLLTWSEHVVSWVNSSGLEVHVLRYEDMHSKPKEAFSSALDFLEIPYTTEILNKAIENSSIHTLQKQEDQHGFQEKPIQAARFFRKGEVRDWENHIGKISAAEFLSCNKAVFDQYY